MMVPNDMATSIRTQMSFSPPNSSQLVGWSSGIINHLITSGLVNFAPGTITGTCPPSGGPLSNGAASMGIVVGLDPSQLASLVQAAAGYPSISTELLKFCQQIVLHIETVGQASFASGNITGACTNTLLTPGSFTGAGMNGTLSNLSGTTLANNIHSAVGYPGSTSNQLINFCNAICNYLMTNADITLALATGVAPVGGGDLSLGTGSGGTFL